MKCQENSAINKNFQLILLIFFISSCTSTRNNINHEPTISINYSTSTAVPNTPTPLPTSFPSPTINIENKCLSIEESLPSDLQLTGVWVRRYANPYLENLEENVKYGVPLDGGGFLHTYEGYWSVSPNGEWLAYLDSIIDRSERIARTEGYSLKVIHSSGHSLSMDYWPAIIFSKIRRWIDNENLLLTLDKRDIVLNPFLGKWYELKKPEWLEKIINEDPWYDYSQYNPHLNQIIVHLNNHSELRDFDSGDNIFGNTAFGFFSESTWSLDGGFLAVVNNHGMIKVFQNKKEILELDLLQFGILEPSYDGIYRINKLEWSLNGKNLLIEIPYHSIVLDIRERKIYNICFFDKNFEKRWVYQDGFFSSTDGQYLIISRSFIDVDSSVQYTDILVDLKNMRAYKLHTPRYSDRIGWLSLP